MESYTSVGGVVTSYRALVGGCWTPSYPDLQQAKKARDDWEKGREEKKKKKKEEAEKEEAEKKKKKKKKKKTKEEEEKEKEEREKEWEEREKEYLEWKTDNPTLLNL